MAKNSLPLAAMERVIRSVDKEKRVSEDAKDALRDCLEDMGREISTAAIKFAQHAGRKTVKAEDIRLAKESKL